MLFVIFVRMQSEHRLTEDVVFPQQQHQQHQQQTTNNKQQTTKQEKIKAEFARFGEIEEFKIITASIYNATTIIVSVRYATLSSAKQAYNEVQNFLCFPGLTISIC